MRAIGSVGRGSTKYSLSIHTLRALPATTVNNSGTNLRRFVAKRTMHAMDTANTVSHASPRLVKTEKKCVSGKVRSLATPIANAVSKGNIGGEIGKEDAEADDEREDGRDEHRRRGEILDLPDMRIVFEREFIAELFERGIQYFRHDHESAGGHEYRELQHRDIKIEGCENDEHRRDHMHAEMRLLPPCHLQSENRIAQIRPRFIDHEKKYTSHDICCG